MWVHYANAGRARSVLDWLSRIPSDVLQHNARVLVVRAWVLALLGREVPLSQVRSTFPVLRNPANRRRAVGFTPEQWHYAFANTFSKEESLALHERYHIPASGHIFWGSALANIHPGRVDTWVDYQNAERAPLLFISGDADT